MPVRKFTVSMPEEAYHAAEQAAREADMSLSAWLTHAALRESRTEAGLRGVAAYEAEYGPLTPAERAEADRVLDQLGVGEPVPEQDAAANAEALRRLRASADPAPSEVRRSA